MSYPFRRASARLAVGLVAAAVPLAGASVAQAAMAGANPVVTTARPDLRSVTLTGASSAQFCFDKAITSVPNIGGFYLGGYRADAFLASTNAVAAGNCVNASFPTSVSGNTDNIEHHSFGQVAEGAVRTTGTLGNRADSTALTGSISNNGTRGLTTAPDLTGVSVVTSGTQQIAFTYDQNVNPNAIVGTAGFHFVTGNGTAVNSDTASVSTTDPKTVIAQFAVGGTPVTPLVSNAVRAYSDAGAVQSQTVEHTPSTFDSQAIPGSSGITSGIPDLVSAVYSRQPGNSTNGVALGGALPAALGAVLGTGFQGTGFQCGTTGSNSCVVVDYTFNEGVNLPLAGTLTQTLLNAVTSHFYAYLSDGSFVHPAAVFEPSGSLTGALPFGVGLTGALPINGSTTVRAIFPVANKFDEYLVKAGVTGPNMGLAGTPPVCTVVGGVLANLSCAVVSSTTLRPNTTGSAPIGGNAGAFASGFSTAPDAFRVSFDTQTNTAQVLFDQRVFTANPGNFVLLDANGNPIASASTVTGQANPDGSTDPLRLGLVTVSFPSPAVQVGNAKALEIRGALGTIATGSAATGTFAVSGGSVFNTGTGTTGTGAAPAGDALNVQQIVSPAATAAYTHLRAGKVKSHKRMTRTYLRFVLAKQLHKTHQKTTHHKTHRHHR